MRISGGNKDRHWHKWLPNDKDTATVKVCSECGARKFWNGEKWVYRLKQTKLIVLPQPTPLELSEAG